MLRTIAATDSHQWFMAQLWDESGVADHRMDVLHRALEEFCGAGPTTALLDKAELSQIVHSIASTGKVPFAWQQLKTLLGIKVEQVVCTYSLELDGKEVLTVADRDGQVAALQRALASHDHPPFTIQRFCEVLVRPHEYYRNPVKLLNAYRKLLGVTGAAVLETGPALRS